MRSVLPLLFFFLLAAPAAAPARANELIRNANTFCTTVGTLNASGLSVAPGTQLAAAVARKAGHTDTTYATYWILAKRLGIASCNRMW